MDEDIKIPVDESTGEVKDSSEDFDLLSLLEQANTEKTEEPKSDLEQAMTFDDDAEADKKLAEIRDLAQHLESQTPSTNNPGSGDLDTDLENWFHGQDVLPSDPLTLYTSGSGAKMTYGISKSTLSNYEMMGRLSKFIMAGIELGFDPALAISLDPDDLQDRLKTAFTMYKDLAALNSRTVLSLAEQRNKFDKEGQDTDRLSMLLASIPNDKLSQLLTELSTSHSSKK